MLNFIYQLYLQVFVNCLYLPFLSLLRLLETEPAGLYILIAIFIVLVIATGKIKIRILPKVLNFLSIFVFILILIVGYVRFSPAIADFFKPSETPTTSTGTTTTPSTNTKPNTQTTPKQQPAPTYQAPKQLYYSVSCSSCWNEGCPHNGYSYGGYDANYHLYYKTLCQACGCNDFKSVSFWK